jgi:hypothetical protein
MTPRLESFGIGPPGGGGGSGRFFDLPVSQMQELLDFPALIPVLQRLLWLVIEFAKGVFGITNRLDDRIQGLTHCISHGILRVLSFPGTDEAFGPPLIWATVPSLGAVASRALSIRQKCRKVIQKDFGQRTI